MELFETAGRGILERWACGFPPSGMVLYCMETGEELRETSLVAAEVEPSCPAETAEDPPWKVRRYAAAGKAALSYRNTPGMAVFSPFRRGQIASYEAAVYLLRDFLRRLRPGFRFPKPVLCLRMGERTTEVERIALMDAGMQAGAGKVLLYRDSLPALRELAAQRRDLRRAAVIHIETCEERG